MYRRATITNGYLLHQGDWVLDPIFLFLTKYKRKVVLAPSLMSCPCCYGDVCETDLISPSPLSSWRQWYDRTSLDQRFEISLAIEDYVKCPVDVSRDEVDALDYDGDADTDCFTDSYFGMDSLAETDPRTPMDSFIATRLPIGFSDTSSDWDSEYAVAENVYISPLAEWRRWYDNLSIEGRNKTALFIKDHVNDDIVSDTDSETDLETEAKRDSYKVPFGGSDTEAIGSSPHDGSQRMAKEDDEDRLMREWFERIGVELTEEMSVLDEKDAWLLGGPVSASEGEESDDESQFDDADDHGYDDCTSDDERGFSQDL